MTSATGRRLARLEGALAPREAVVAWLVDAHQFPSLTDHVRAIAERPVEAAPLSVIGERVEASVRASMKGPPRDAVDEAVRRAIGDAVFLFTLALLINTETIEFSKVEGLRAAGVFLWMGVLLGGPRSADLPSAEAKVYVRELADAWVLWRTVVDRLRLDVRVEAEARATLQERYFGGYDVLFADARTGVARARRSGRTTDERCGRPEPGQRPDGKLSRSGPPPGDGRCPRRGARGKARR
jgi:hypothetical protein